jgi:ATP-dependent Clp protease ATP-binding subunit ClpA
MLTIDVIPNAPVVGMADDDRKRKGDPGGPGTAVITKTKPQTKRPNHYRVLLRAPSRICHARASAAGADRGRSGCGAVMRACNVDLEKLRRSLVAYLESELDNLVTDGAEDSKPTAGFQRVIQRAVIHVQSSGREEVTGANVLVAMFAERESHAVYFLQEQDMTRYDAVNYISHGIAKRPGMSDPRAVRGADEERTTEEQSARSQEKGDALDAYCVNLNKKARDGKIDPLIGREPRSSAPSRCCAAAEEQSAVCRRSRRRQDRDRRGPGAPHRRGRSAGSAAQRDHLRARHGRAARRHALSRRFRGAAEAGHQGARGLSRRDPVHRRDPHRDRRRRDLGRRDGRLQPAQAGAGVGHLRCIGSTTYKEYRNYFEKDRALVRRFQKIDVNEPTIEDAIKILKGLKPYYEEHHKLRYTNEAIKAAVELSARYIHDRKLPDKAIDVIDEVGAAQMLLPENKRKKTIGIKEIEATSPPWRAFRRRACRRRQEVLAQLERDLKRVVFGQDKAIEALAAAIKLARAGLREPEKPIGCYLFSGPTGVGKTEVARQLAATLGIELIRFDMSEYMERHTVSRLIGAPPGYVGFDQGGLLTDAIDQHPHCVLLLDEIEKAHPDLFNILLQVMDHGKLTDHNGKQVDFRNVILIMTTNAGAPIWRRRRSASRAKREGEDRKRSTACSRRNSATGSTRSSRSRI